MDRVSDTNERRNKHRFEIEREIRYKITGDGMKPAAGVGKTIDLSSSGASFTVEQAVRPGAFVELSISWPVLLDNSCPMRLVVFGRVLRTMGLTAACSIDKYEFRTAARTNVLTMAVNRTDTAFDQWTDGARKDSMRISRAGA